MAAEALDPEAHPERARAVRAVRNGAVVLIMLAAVVAAGWLALGGDVRRGQAPTIAADASPERAPPDPNKPSGALIPHQDQVVYDIVAPDRAKPAAAEKMAPPAEKPLSPPSPSAALDRRPGQGGAPMTPVQILPPAPEPDRIGGGSSPADPPRAVTSAPLPDLNLAPPKPPAAAPAPLSAPPDATPQSAPETAPETAPTPTPPKRAPSPPKELAALPPAAKPEPPPLVPPASQRAAAAGFRIQLGAVRDKAAAQREWRRLKRKHDDILGGLQLVIQAVDIAGKGVFHRIQAGPLPEKELAEIACDQLKSRKAACFVITR